MSTDINSQNNAQEREGYPGEDKFLHFFELKSPASCFCGLSLRVGVIILSTLCLLIDISSLVAAGSFLEFLCIALDAFASGCLLYGAIYNIYRWAFIGYFIYMIFFWINVAFAIIVFVFLIVFFPSLKLLIIFTLLILVVFALKLAFMWIIYSWVVEVRKNGYGAVVTADSNTGNNSNNSNNATGNTVTGTQA